MGQTLPDGWMYIGDRDLCAGGMFVKVDAKEYRWGFLETVEVTDLDSAAGATGMCLIEARTAIIDRQGEGRKHMRSAIESAGWTVAEARQLFRRDRSLFMAEMARLAVQYGRCDPRQPDHMWDDTPQSMVVQCEPGGPRKVDGWKAEKFIRPDDLAGFVASTWLD